jgi:hypothetical protein
MSSLHFLKKQDVGCHGRDGLLDAMDARSRTDGTHAFVNIPSSDAKFHAVRRFNLGRNMSRGASRVIGRGTCRGIRRFMARNRRLDVSGDGFEDSALTG